ncbi:MAG: hypothetical protein RLZZ314_1190 [Bacteroidota bacterium]|jgi:hypothetical protein
MTSRILEDVAAPHIPRDREPKQNRARTENRTEN